MYCVISLNLISKGQYKSCMYEVQMHEVRTREIVSSNPAVGKNFSFYNFPLSSRRTHLANQGTGQLQTLNYTARIFVLVFFNNIRYIKQLYILV